MDATMKPAGKGTYPDAATEIAELRARVAALQEELREQSRVLDARIEERTRELVQSRDRLQALNALATVLSTSLSLEKTLQAALAKALDVMGADAGAIHLVERESGKLRLAGRQALSGEAAEQIVRLQPGEPVGGPAIHVGRALVVSDVTKYRRARKAEVQAEGLRSLAQVPLKSKGVVVGVLSVLTREPREFTQADMELLRSMAGQIALAIDNAQVYEELSRKDKLRGELLDRVITAQEDERRRVARELHDETCQALVAQVAAIEMALGCADDPKKVRASLHRMRSLAEMTLEEVHKLIFNLRPTMLDDLGLISAIRSCAESRLPEAGIALHLEINGEERRLPPQVETALYRVAQEAINNVIRHSGAEHASISVDIDASAVRIDVEDDGRGFDPAQVARPNAEGRGLGLLGMRERITLLGGTLTIHSQPAAGTRVTIRVPLDEEGKQGG